MVDIREKVQKEAVKAYNRDGILHVSVRVGKTRIGLMCIEKLLAKKVLVCYPEDKIKGSWQDEVKKMSYGGDITYTNYRSLHKYVEEKWDMVVFDEIHATSSAQREEMKKLIGVYPCLGLTGTMNKWTKKEMLEMGMPVLYTYDREQAIKDKILAPYTITIHYVELDNVKTFPNSKGKMITERKKYRNYSSVIDKMESEGRDSGFLKIRRAQVLQDSYAKRVKTISLLKKLEGRVVVFAGLKKQAESLGIPFYHSGVKDPQVFQDFKDGKIERMAFANMGKVGITYQNLDNLILQSFTGNEEVAEQILARVLNRDYEEKVANIHIICTTEQEEMNKLNRILQSFEYG